MRAPFWLVSKEAPGCLDKGNLDLLCKEHGSFAWFSFVPQRLSVAGGDLQAKALVHFVGGPHSSLENTVAGKQRKEREISITFFPASPLHCVLTPSRS